MTKLTIVTDRRGKLIGAVQDHVLSWKVGEIEAHVSFAPGHKLHKVDIDIDSPKSPIRRNLNVTSPGIFQKPPQRQKSEAQRKNLSGTSTALQAGRAAALHFGPINFGDALHRRSVRIFDLDPVARAGKAGRSAIGRKWPGCSLASARLMWRASGRPAQWSSASSYGSRTPVSTAPHLPQSKRILSRPHASIRVVPSLSNTSGSAHPGQFMVRGLQVWPLARAGLLMRNFPLQVPA
jgi:hypothetical protein